MRATLSRARSPAALTRHPTSGVRASREIREHVGAIPCLRGLDATALDALRRRARERTLPRGAVLFREGAPCAGVLVVGSGKVKISRLSPEGRQQTLWILSAGDCFCVAPFFYQGRYPGTAQCMTEVRVFELGRAALLDLPTACPGLPEAVIACLCDRLAATAALLEDVSTQHVRHRLGRLLLALARRRDGTTPHDGAVIDGWTHEELAACVGTVREVASRALKQLERDGLVRLGRRRVVLCDTSRLQASLTVHPDPGSSR